MNLDILFSVTLFCFDVAIVTELTGVVNNFVHKFSNNFRESGRTLWRVEWIYTAWDIEMPRRPLEGIWAINYSFL
uniref:Phage protein n=1 Tax=Klebsiella phage PMBT63 TaxID=3229739 RepID=A0AB39C2X8_9CAUD